MTNPPTFDVNLRGLSHFVAKKCSAKERTWSEWTSGASAIKVVQLKESRKKLQVVRYGFAPLPAQAIIDGHVMNSGAVVESLQRIFHDNKISQKDVAIGVYGQSVIVRKITVPMMTNEELEEQIGWEAEQHIPFDIKVMSIDYEVLRRRPEAGQMDLLLVAAKKDEINDYAAIVREAKLKPVIVDINAFTIQKHLSSTSTVSPEDGTIALLNVGAAVFAQHRVEGRQRLHPRDYERGELDHAKRFQKQCNVPFEQAEAYKCGGGPTDIVPQEVHQIIQSACDSLAGEIQRSLDFYLATSGESEISRIFVSGGSALSRAALSVDREESPRAGAGIRPDGEPRGRRQGRQRAGNAQSRSAAGGGPQASACVSDKERRSRGYA